MSVWHKWSVTSRQPSLSGRVALVTGGNSGLGFETACGLAKRGAKLLLPVRNPAKGEEALKALSQRCPGVQAQLLQLDLASLASVKACADSVFNHTEQLDFLINNAGVMAPPRRQETLDGFELQFGTNHLGHFALTSHLRPLLQAARGGGTVVTVASLAAHKTHIHFDDLQFRHHYSPFTAYQQSKLANLLFARELARKAGEAGWALHSRAAHPGWSSTSIIANGPAASTPPALSILQRTAGGAVLRLMGQSAARGAEASLYAALSPDACDGDYYGPQGSQERRGQPGPARVPAEARKTSTAERLWDVSERLTGVAW
ncbi:MULTISPECIES: SDR family oxidoreductase [Acetobacter]|uniref:SDR family oxidoreductase n=1 Tax=Acetobacter thailandicus TaxID=1502842 RepID=A0ABT3QDR0_9PROT|nr:MULTISPECIES: SDR family oxidoreductase [Acetobacter]MBS0985410.1 SDR family oxidoreductase [Acetobacter thailandicus]MBS1004220.1 SDR family oxidoreductase [Acetobacter thailandicus]MCX2563424.1 SDR family oxidoreductase [Acetobacter thailandicus]NHN94178.1 SDR family NAD(P)-dependent oxidoreductase [Acetobacter thailandicus]OUI88743.1 oxidoreductase [Acetobacter sp. DmW_043]